MKMTCSRAGQLTHRMLYRPADQSNIVSKMQFTVFAMESTLIFPLEYFLFLSHQLYKAIKTKVRKTAQRSFKKIKVPKVFSRRRESFLL